MVHDPTVYCNMEWFRHHKAVKATTQVTFGWDGRVFEMSLSPGMLELFDKTMQAFAECANDTGLKMPPLPRNLRENFDDLPEQFTIGDISQGPPMLPLAPISALTKKPATPAFTPAKAVAPKPKKTETVKEPEPPAKIPEDDHWWTAPKGLPYRDQKLFAEARAGIWALAGHQPVKGNIPAEILKYAPKWAENNPEKVAELRRLRGLIHE